jgi:outer membrane lipoprotein-sorting protein
MRLNPSRQARPIRRCILKKVLALAAIALVFLLGAAFQSSNSVPDQLKDIQSQLSGLAAQVASNSE